MSSSEYPQAALEYVQSRGWSANVTKLRDGLYMISGSREIDSTSEKMLLMVVCEPESMVSIEHIKYLLKAAQRKSINNIALTTKIEASDEAKRAMRQNNISSVTIENQQPQREDAEMVKLTVVDRAKYF